MRQVQLEAVKRAGVKCQRLEGRYPRSGIRAIYRKAGAFLMSRSEAFGLPISEVQACGSLVFLPDPHWAAAHWLGDNFYIKREPALTSNFVVYENDAESLASRLRSAAENFNPAEVRQTFIREQPQLSITEMAMSFAFFSTASRMVRSTLGYTASTTRLAVPVNGSALQALEVED
jgi:glycosyltransferase involved in cell wall biosynthesis